MYCQGKSAWIYPCMHTSFPDNTLTSIVYACMYMDTIHVPIIISFSVKNITMYTPKLTLVHDLSQLMPAHAHNVYIGSGNVKSGDPLQVSNSLVIADADDGSGEIRDISFLLTCTQHTGVNKTVRTQPHNTRGRGKQNCKHTSRDKLYMKLLLV